MYQNKHDPKLSVIEGMSKPTMGQQTKLTYTMENHACSTKMPIQTQNNTITYNKTVTTTR